MKTATIGTIVVVMLAVTGILILVTSRSVAVEAAYPVERARQTFVRRVLARVTGCFRGAEARAENVRLKRELAVLSLVRSDLERLEAENARLRQALEYRKGRSETWLAAGVLSSGGGAAAVRATVRVDKGTLDGVREGAVVMVPEGLVGRIGSVTPHMAEVILLSDGRVKVACEVETGARKHPQGILGGGGDVLVLRHLTGAAEVPSRARVLTSGRGGVFPRGLVIGTLLNVRKDSGDLVREGDVLPAVDPSALEDVFIRREK